MCMKAAPPDSGRQLIIILTVCQASILPFLFCILTLKVACRFLLPHHTAPRDQQPWLTSVLSNKQPPLIVSEPRAFVFINAVHSDMLVGKATGEGFRWAGRISLVRSLHSSCLSATGAMSPARMCTHSVEAAVSLDWLFWPVRSASPSQHRSQQESWTQYSSLSWKQTPKQRSLWKWFIVKTQHRVEE